MPDAAIPADVPMATVDEPAPPPAAPARLSGTRTLFTPRGWTGVAAALAVIAVAVPVFNLAVPAGSPLHLSDYFVALLGKIMCYAMLALAMDLIWGYTGILSLGH